MTKTTNKYGINFQARREISHFFYAITIVAKPWNKKINFWEIKVGGEGWSLQKQKYGTHIKITDHDWICYLHFNGLCVYMRLTQQALVAKARHNLTFVTVINSQ